MCVRRLPSNEEKKGEKKHSGDELRRRKDEGLYNASGNNAYFISRPPNNNIFVNKIINNRYQTTGLALRVFIHSRSVRRSRLSLRRAIISIKRERIRRRQETLHYLQNCYRAIFEPITPLRNTFKCKLLLRASIVR